MAYSELNIVNSALNKLGADPIEDLDDTDAVSVLCKATYPTTRDFVLRDHSWNCAVRKADLGVANVPPVESYFDDSVYNQGTYALRVIVKTAANAYNFLRHSYAVDLDISGLDSIKIDLRSTFVGTTEVYFLFHSKLSGNWSSNTETISEEDEWETKTFDISSIAQNLREDVDRVEIRFENKTSDYMVYIDNMFATSGVTGDEIKLDYMEYSSNSMAHAAYKSEYSLLLFGWAYRFDLPDGTGAYEYCLKVLQVDEDRKNFRVEDRKILINEDTAQIEYIRRVSDPTDYDSMLYDAIALRLAYDISMKITDDPKVTATMFELYDVIMIKAKRKDAQEGTPKEIFDRGSWINSRFT